MMNSEMHLFIVWSNAKHKLNDILKSVEGKFRVIGVHNVSWDKHNFATNLTRFYGENLPRNSNKEKLCGNNPFTLIVVMDDAPLYRVRKTSKGPKVVNVNMFDSKELFRYWTGGGHLIHGTNSEQELRHDLVLLTGYSRTDYLQKVDSLDGIFTESFAQMPGEKTWVDVNQLIYTLNETVNYVVLRNFDGLFSEYNRKLHGDVDILTENRYLAQLALNAKPLFTSKKRTRHVVRIGDGGLFFDIRFIGDKYYCDKWEHNILANRTLDEKGFYKPSNCDYMYSLLYHALVHKPKISKDYSQILNSYFVETKNEEDLIKELVDYLEKSKYDMTEPYDYSVYFNSLVAGKSMSLSKIACKAYHKLFK